MDWLLWLTASGSTLVAYGIGTARGRRARPKVNSSITPTCGCGHVLAMHDPQTKQCHEVWGPSRDKKCKCRQYIGPLPIDQVFQPGYVLPPSQEST